MGNRSPESAVQNATHQAKIARDATRARLDDANTLAQGSKVTVRELKNRS